jgi:hypothetical protein
MKKSKVSRRDIEALSSYLDGELSPTERTELVRRMRQDTGLQEELKNLQQARSVLRALPKARAPRNYTLKPHMLGLPITQPRRNLFPAARLVTVLATIFFIVVVGSDLITGGYLPFKGGIAAVPEMVEPVEMLAMEDMVVTDEVEVEETVIPPAALEVEGTPTEEMFAGMGGGQEPTPTAKETAMEERAAVPETPTELSYPTEPPLDIATKNLPEEETPISIIRYVEGGLLGVAIVAGVLAWYWWRKWGR